MIRRAHTTDTTESYAYYSECERYRYALSRKWRDGESLAYIMLNPSKATEVQNDPTIERCQRRSVALGYGAMTILNLFAWRETDPAKLRRVEDPVGEENEAALRSACLSADTILCAWGVNGAHRGQGEIVEARLREMGKPLHTLGLTKQGYPRHPLYVSYDTPLQVW